MTAIEIIKAHIPSLTDENAEEINALAANLDYDGPDAADYAIRTCSCGQRIDGFYEYVNHLASVLPAGPTTISRQEREDINEALDYTAEDLSYRMGNGVDFEPEDIPEIEAKLERFEAISVKLNTMTEETK